MPQTRTHLVIGTPCYGGQVTSLYTTSLMRLQNACLQRGGIDLSVNLLSGDALITRARQNVVAHFLENPLGTHLIFIDADIAFGPEQVFRLLDFNVDMAAGVYPTKRIDWGKVTQLAKAGMSNLESSALSYVLEFENPAKIEQRNGFAKVLYAGTGFLMLKRQALVKMVESYPELHYRREHQAEDPLKGSKWRSALFNCMIEKETGVYLSEDYSFCRRWRDLGGEIWVDLQSQLAHTGTMTFYGNAATQFLAPAEQPKKS
jgi:hypothetical protein